MITEIYGISNNGSGCSIATNAAMQGEFDEDMSDWFRDLGFICRVLEGTQPDRRDMDTALGMARVLRRKRRIAEKAPISVNDVTDAMVKILDKTTHESSSRKEIIAAAFNAVRGDSVASE